jgi:hypothetical protein
MSRQPEIEAILEAWWDLDHGAPPERAKAETRLHQLLDLAVRKSDGRCSRYQIQSALFDRYRAFRIERRQMLKVQIAQSSLGRS